MNPKSASILSPRDLELIRNYLVGGAALGGGTALVTSLANHLKTLKQEGTTDSVKDDDTIYLNVPASRNKMASMGGGLALAGGALATLGTYAAVRKAYQNIKRKRLQDELDKAQNAYLGSVETEAKSAADGKPMSIMEMLTSAPIAAPIILGLGSGVLANKFLNSSFPSRRKRQYIGPRKVVLRETPPTDSEIQPEEVKSASDEANGIEFLVQLVLGTEKRAAESDLSDMIAAAAAGRCSEMEIAFTNDVATAFNLIKGAAEKPSIAPLTTIATSYIAKSALLAPVVKVLAAAEFADMAPIFFKIASELDDETQDALEGVMNDLGAAIRHDNLCDYVRQPVLQKDAAAVAHTPHDQILARFLDKANDVPETTVNSGSSENNQDPEHGQRSPEIVAKGHPLGNTKHNGNKDIIDSVLSADTQPEHPHQQHQPLPDNHNPM